MAKKAKENSSEVERPYKYEPRLHVDLGKKDLSLLKEVKIGQTVSMVIKGKVVALSQREDEEYGPEGNVTLKGYAVEKIDNGVFSQLAED